MVTEPKMVYILLLTVSIITVYIIGPRLVKVLKLNRKYGNGAGLGGLIYLADILLYSLVFLVAVSTIIYLGWTWLRGI
jgi:hypothetical protein